MNIEFFFPTSKSLRQWSDRKKYINTPLFPSYIFVKLEALPQYFRILDSKGVLKFVKFGNELALVKSALIETLKIVVNMGTPMIIEDYNFNVDDSLIIKEGPLIGHRCSFIQKHNSYRVSVKIDILKRTVIADLPMAILKKA